MYGGYVSMKDAGLKHVGGQIGKGLAVTFVCKDGKVTYPVLTKRVGACEHYFVFHGGRNVWLGKKDI